MTDPRWTATNWSEDVSFDPPLRFPTGIPGIPPGTTLKDIRIFKPSSSSSSVTHTHAHQPGSTMSNTQLPAWITSTAVTDDREDRDKLTSIPKRQFRTGEKATAFHPGMLLRDANQKEWHLVVEDPKETLHLVEMVRASGVDGWFTPRRRQAAERRVVVNWKKAGFPAMETSGAPTEFILSQLGMRMHHSVVSTWSQYQAIAGATVDLDMVLRPGST